MSSSVSGARWRGRALPIGIAVAAIPVTIAIATTLRPVDLLIVLLICLLEVVGVSLLAGRAVAAITAVATVAGVNWFLVDPYSSFRATSQDSILALVAFAVLAAGISSLIESVLKSERAASAANVRESMLVDALRPTEGGAPEALAAFRDAFGLDRAVLIAQRPDRLLLSTSGEQEIPAGQAAIDVPVGVGYRLVGVGGEVMGMDTGFAATMATAVVRAWESQELSVERERSARLAEIDQARAALLASVGHDLRTPLAGIMVSADALALAEDRLSPAERSELLAGLRESAIRLDQILGAVLDTSRIEAGVISVRKEPVDLSAMVQAAVGAWADPRLRFNAGPRMRPVLTDGPLLERIIGNLISNALVHTPPAAPIEVATSTWPGGALISVADHGPGLSSAGVDQGRSSSGLGLLIVDRLAEIIDAHLEYTPTTGGGLTVTVRLTEPLAGS